MSSTATQNQPTTTTDEDDFLAAFIAIVRANEIAARDEAARAA